MIKKKPDISNMIKYEPGGIILRGEPEADLGVPTKPGQVAIQYIKGTKRHRPPINNPRGSNDDGKFGTSISMIDNDLYIFAPTVGRKGKIPKSRIYRYLYNNTYTGDFHYTGICKTLPVNEDNVKYLSAVVTKIDKKKVIITLLDNGTICILDYNNPSGNVSLISIDDKERNNKSIYINNDDVLVLKTSKFDLDLDFNWDESIDDYKVDIYVGDEVLDKEDV